MLYNHRFSSNYNIQQVKKVCAPEVFTQCICKIRMWGFNVTHGLFLPEKSLITVVEAVPQESVQSRWFNLIWCWFQQLQVWLPWSTTILLHMVAMPEAIWANSGYYQSHFILIISQCFLLISKIWRVLIKLTICMHIMCRMWIMCLHIGINVQMDEGVVPNWRNVLETSKRAETSIYFQR